MNKKELQEVTQAFKKLTDEMKNTIKKQQLKVKR